MSHNHAKPMVTITMTMRMMYSIIGTSLSYSINNDHRLGFLPLSTRDPDRCGEYYLSATEAASIVSNRSSHSRDHQPLGPAVL
jgi:hypothetical protein